MNAIDRFVEPLKVVIFTSPKAGTGVGREQIPDLVTRVERSGGEAAIVKEVAELEQLVADGGRLVTVAAGGDGTLALAAQTINPEVPLVPMPMGTENLLARHFGHRGRGAAVFDTIARGNERQIDAGLANGRPFLIMASCGFDAEVVRAMHLTRRGHINRLSYAKPIFRALRRYGFPKIEVRIDDEADAIPECGWCFAFNLPRYAAGLNIEPDAAADDGKLDFVGFQGGSIGSGLRYLAGVATGRHLHFRDVVRRRVSSLKITSPGRVPYQLDGDYVGHLPLTIETLPKRVKLLVPPDR